MKICMVNGCHLDLMLLLVVQVVMPLAKVYDLAEDAVTSASKW